jgi:hypothetical protein
VCLNRQVGPHQIRHRRFLQHQLLAARQLQNSSQVPMAFRYADLDRLDFLVGKNAPAHGIPIS